MIDSIIQIGTCAIFIVACLFSIWTEHERKEQLDQIYKRMQEKWKNDEDFPK